MLPLQFFDGKEVLDMATVALAILACRHRQSPTDAHDPRYDSGSRIYNIIVFSELNESQRPAQWHKGTSESSTEAK